MTEVTEADRKAAADLMNEWKAFRGTMMENTVHAFARHRTEALEAAAKVARDCAIYDADDQMINCDVRATCAAAIRNMKDQP